LYESRNPCGKKQRANRQQVMNEMRNTEFSHGKEAHQLSIYMKLSEDEECRAAKENEIKLDNAKRLKKAGRQQQLNFNVPVESRKKKRPAVCPTPLIQNQPPVSVSLACLRPDEAAVATQLVDDTAKIGRFVDAMGGNGTALVSSSWVVSNELIMAELLGASETHFAIAPLIPQYLPGRIRINASATLSSVALQQFEDKTRRLRQVVCRSR
jgi:hypothetical protein